MNPRVLTLALMALSLGCGGQSSSDSASSTPPGANAPVELVQPATDEIRADLAQVLDSLDERKPGASTTALSEFLLRHRGYETDALVEREIERFRSVAKGRYHAARELARRGEFDEAEAILTDLARNLPDTPDGEMAVEHLDFGFYMNRAQHLMMRQRFDEAGVLARKVLELDLSPVQAAQAEQVLDTVGQANAAFGMIERQEAYAATRQLLITLEMQYVEEGQYPYRVSLRDVERWDPMNGRAILRGLSKIERYSVGQHSVSFVAVSADGNHRIEVVDGEIQRDRAR